MGPTPQASHAGLALALSDQEWNLPLRILYLWPKNE